MSESELEFPGSYSEPEGSFSCDTSGNGGAFLLVGGPFTFFASSFVTTTLDFLGVTFFVGALVGLVWVMFLSVGFSLGLFFLGLLCFASGDSLQETHDGEYRFYSLFNRLPGVEFELFVCDICGKKMYRSIRHGFDIRVSRRYPQENASHF